MMFCRSLSCFIFSVFFAFFVLLSCTKEQAPLTSECELNPAVSCPDVDLSDEPEPELDAEPEPNPKPNPKPN